MNQFEKIINNGKFEKDTIQCVVINNDLNANFQAEVNGTSIYEVSEKIHNMGNYELDLQTTLYNYFAPSLVHKYILELENSWYIYNLNFSELLEFGFKLYTDALSNGDYETISNLDRNR